MIAASLLLLSAQVSSGPPAGIAFRNRLDRAEGGALVLGDVATLDGLPPDLQRKAAGLQLAVLPERMSAKTFSHAELASRARALLPALGPWLTGANAGALVVSVGHDRQAGMTADCGEAGIDAGSTVVVRFDMPAFAIERAGTALQPGTPGSRFFARTADGTVLTVQCKERT